MVKLVMFSANILGK